MDNLYVLQLVRLDKLCPIDRELLSENCMALLHSSFRVESCLVVLSVLSLSCTRGQNYCWLHKITCRVFKCISLAKTITWQQNSRGPFLLGLQFELFLCRLKVFSNGHPRKGKVELLFVILGHSFDHEWRVENCWFARDVTTAMLVVKNKSISLFWELNSIFM